jgi:integrase/recombinase XerD
MHDARHFYAIRAVRAGTPYELVARQLGHADVQMVARVYGRYAPRSDERDRWEKIAAELDAAEAKAAKARADEQTRKAKSGEKVREMGAPAGAHLRTSRANHREVIGSMIAGVGLEPTTPAL